MKVTLLIVLVLLTLPACSHETTPQESVRKFVQDFYDWYVPVALEKPKGPAWDIAVTQKSSVFSPKLLKAFQEEAIAQSKTDELGLDYDPFLYSQDPEDHYKPGKIENKNGSFWINIHSVRDGKMSEKPNVIAEVRKEKGLWVFLNFYSTDGQDLLTSLEALKA